MSEKRKVGRPKGRLLININDIVGRRVGKLVVIKHEFYKYETSKCGTRLKHFYLCKCDCGKFAIVNRCQLLNSMTQSCGCSKKRKKNDECKRKGIT